jgi:hypothetical protein
MNFINVSFSIKFIPVPGWPDQEWLFPQIRQQVPDPDPQYWSFVCALDHIWQELVNVQVFVTIRMRRLTSSSSIQVTNISLVSVRIYSKTQYCGSGMFFPDPNFSIPNLGSKSSRIRIRIRELNYCICNPKLFLSSRYVHPRSWIRILIFYSSRILGSKRLRICNTGKPIRFVLEKLFWYAIYSG